MDQVGKQNIKDETIFHFSFCLSCRVSEFCHYFFKLTGRQDPRLGFSGNAGTTNVYRQAGILWAAVVFLLDIGRALTVAAVTLYFLPKPLLPWAGFFLVLGNSYPCFHHFQGGKGVANYLGFIILIAPWAAVFAAALWMIAYGIVRVPFIASFLMVFVLTVGEVLTLPQMPSAVTGAVATFLLILFNHKKISLTIAKRSGRPSNNFFRIPEWHE